MTKAVSAPFDFRLRVDLVPGEYRVCLHDDGTVTDTQSGDVMWLDCPACGTRAPVLSHRTEEPVMFGNGFTGWTQVGVKVRYEVGRLLSALVENPRTGRRERQVGARCECGFWARLRLIRHTGTDGRGKVRDGRWYCSGACLGGRHMCDCRCQGKCHGRGHCDGH